MREEKKKRPHFKNTQENAYADRWVLISKYSLKNCVFLIFFFSFFRLQYTNKNNKHHTPFSSTIRSFSALAPDRQLISGFSQDNLLVKHVRLPFHFLDEKNNNKQQHYEIELRKKIAANFP